MYNTFIKYSLVASLLVLFSCSENKESKPNLIEPKATNSVQKKWFSLECPAGWEITEEDTIGTDGFYMSCIKKIEGESAIFTVSALGDSMDLNQLIQMFQENLQRNELYQLAELQFEPAQTGQYGKYKCLTSPFTITLVGVVLKGNIHVFYGNKRTYGILNQYSIKNTSTVVPDLNAIENSFTAL